MTDRPIIFSAPMVRALFDGRKTQTRRLATSPLRKCEPGDRLWVRESGIRWPARLADFGGTFRHDVPVTEETGRYWTEIRRGPGAYYSVKGCSRAAALAGRGKVCPAIHMPRWASRLTLHLEGVRTEQLQAISEADALAEGIERLQFPEVGDWGWPQRRYRDLWTSLHGGDSWETNPEVLVLTFWIEQGNVDGRGS
jgi:hypothetical protein